MELNVIEAEVIEVEASTLTPGRMMARLVHIPYQLFQPNEFDSITDRARAFEMPEGPSPGTGCFGSGARVRCFSSGAWARCFISGAWARCFSSGARARCFISGAWAPQPTRCFRAPRPTRCFRAPRPTRCFRAPRPTRCFRAPRPTRCFRAPRPALCFRTPQPMRCCGSGAWAPQPAPLHRVRAPQPVRRFARALRFARPSMGHRCGTPDVSAEFPARSYSGKRALSGKAAHAGAPHRGDSSLTRGARGQQPFGAPFRSRLPSRPACGTFSLRTRAMVPRRVSHGRASLPPPQRAGDAAAVRTPVCLPSCFIMLRNTPGWQSGRAARLVLRGPLVRARPISPRHGSASRAMGKPC
jgi:hypothetical protein